MSDPVRITNPGAESLGYDSDGHEIMAVDIYVNPPRVDVFHGTPPAWSSFGNKTIWGGNEGTVAKLAMRQPFVLFKGLTFQKLCLPGAFRPGDHHNKMLRPGLCVVHASPQYL